MEDLIEFINTPREEETLNLMIVFENVHALRQAIDLGLKVKEVQFPYPASRYLLKRLDDYFSPTEVQDIRAIQKKKK
ncbi:hypothetical protein [Lacticaseibacillus nasuensis]|uniref:hypothetical protein n=1 Tax=Lacticaseibacillus nasuensis TaxID=944671 RepID=UPI0021E834CD|nr:hypothetical protein [Lacticaseibacillus nasuensis]